MRRGPSTPAAGLVPLALLAAAALAGCSGSARTALPSSVVPPPTQPVVAAAETTTTAAAATTTAAGSGTTAGPYVSAGLKQDLLGGSVAASYPKYPINPPKGSPGPPAGQVYAVLEVKLCAGKGGPLAAAYLDPARFQVEVPGQGFVAFDPAVPQLRGAPPTRAALAPGACTSGVLTYAIGGEQHIESVTYDTGAGLLRWAS